METKGRKKIGLYGMMMIFFLVLSLSTITGKVMAASDFVIKDGVLVTYKGNSSSVYVPDGVKKIGASAFEGNNTIVYVKLPNSVETIGAQAFYECSNLRTVSCGDKIKYIK